MIIWLASYPRSGNTFFRILAHQVFGLHTYSGFMSGNSDLERVGLGDLTGHEQLPEELASALRDGDKDVWSTFHNSQKIYLIKTHAMRTQLKVSEVPTILLVRDARDTYISMAWYWITVAHKWRSESKSKKARLAVRLEQLTKALGLKRPLFKIVLDRLISSRSWAQFHESWLSTPHPNLVVLRFDELVEDPITACKEAFEKVGIRNEASAEADAPTFEELHGMHPQFFRQGQTGRWRTEFSNRLLESFWSGHQNTMEKLGFSA